MLGPLKEAGHKVLFIKVNCAQIIMKRAFSLSIDRSTHCLLSLIKLTIDAYNAHVTIPNDNQHMAKHIVKLDTSAFLKRTHNMLLIRQPVDMLSSWAEKMGTCTSGFCVE